MIDWFVSGREYWFCFVEPITNVATLSASVGSLLFTQCFKRRYSLRRRMFSISIWYFDFLKVFSSTAWIGTQASRLLTVDAVAVSRPVVDREPRAQEVGPAEALHPCQPCEGIVNPQKPTTARTPPQQIIWTVYDAILPVSICLDLHT